MTNNKKFDFIFQIFIQKIKFTNNFYSFKFLKLILNLLQLMKNLNATDAYIL
jgi:hypothetical protein